MNPDTHPVERTIVMLDCLSEVFGGDAQAATALGVPQVVLARWRRGEQPSDTEWDRLIDLFAVVQKLAHSYTPARIRAWFRGTNAHLGDRSPLYLIRHGESGRVYEAIHAQKAGAFA